MWQSRKEDRGFKVEKTAFGRRQHFLQDPIRLHQELHQKSSSRLGVSRCQPSLGALKSVLFEKTIASFDASAARLLYQQTHSARIGRNSILCEHPAALELFTCSTEQSKSCKPQRQLGPIIHYLIMVLLSTTLLYSCSSFHESCPESQWLRQVS